MFAVPEHTASDALPWVQVKLCLPVIQHKNLRTNSSIPWILALSANIGSLMSCRFLAEPNFSSTVGSQSRIEPERNDFSTEPNVSRLLLDNIWNRHPDPALPQSRTLKHTNIHAELLWLLVVTISLSHVSLTKSDPHGVSSRQSS